MLRVALVAFLSLVYVPGSQAQTLYVSDLLRITIRTGPSTENQILEQVQSGDTLEVLEPEVDGWVKVRSAKGTEGYAMRRFLLDDRIARDRLVEAEARLEQLLAGPESLEARLVSTQQENASLKTQNAELSREVQQMAENLAEINQTAANALAISTERDELITERNQLLLDLDQAEIDNRF